MAFRDHLKFAQTNSEPVSLIHGMWEVSKQQGHPITYF